MSPDRLLLIHQETIAYMKQELQWTKSTRPWAKRTPPRTPTPQNNNNNNNNRNNWDFHKAFTSQVAAWIGQKPSQLIQAYPSAHNYNHFQSDCSEQDSHATAWWLNTPEISHHHAGERIGNCKQWNTKFQIIHFSGIK